MKGICCFCFYKHHTSGKYEDFVQKRYERDIINILGIVIKKKVAFKTKMKWVFILLNNPRNEKYRLTLFPIIKLVNRKLQSIKSKK